MAENERVPYEPDVWDSLQGNQEHTPEGEWHMRRFAKAIGKGMHPPDDTMDFLNEAFTGALKELDESRHTKDERVRKNRGAILNKHLPLTDKDKNIPIENRRELQDRSAFQRAFRIEILMLQDEVEAPEALEQVAAELEFEDGKGVDASVLRKQHNKYKEKARNCAALLSISFSKYKKSEFQQALRVENLRLDSDLSKAKALEQVVIEFKSSNLRAVRENHQKYEKIAQQIASLQ